MNQLRCQCLVGSATFHGLLLVIVFAGSGFLVSPREPTWETLPVLDFVPTDLVEAAVVGGGDPRGGAPSPVPPQPSPARAETPRSSPASAPRRVEKPAAPSDPARTEPVKAPPAKAAVADPEAFSETANRKPTPKPRIEVSKTLVTRHARDEAAARKKAAEQAEAEAEAETARWAERARQARRGQLSGAVSKLQGNLSGRSVVAVPYGPGGGGATYAGYGLFVRMVYERAWRPPVEVPDRSSVVTARVVVARDGQVIAAEVVTRSGSAALDNSVVAALGRVTTIGRPFPDGSKDEQKTFLIDFDLQAKRGTG